MSRNILVIGAGIVGASIAYHLARRGDQVTIVDSRSPASGASGASDGAVSIATKSPGTLMQLAVLGKSYYQQIARDNEVLAGIYSERPSFLIASNTVEAELLSRQAQTLTEMGVPVQEHSPQALSARLPALVSSARLALEIGQEGHAIGYEVVHRLLRSSQATIRSFEEVKELLYDGNGRKCIGVRLTDSTLMADHVVLAAGMGICHLLPGTELLPQRGQLIITERTALANKFPGSVYFASYLAAKARNRKQEDAGVVRTSLVIDPLATGQLLIGSTREPDGNSKFTSFETAASVLADATRNVAGIGDVDILRVFSGVRACTPDNLPVVGPVPGVHGLWVAGGFGGDGICLAPIIGRELQRLIHDESAIPEMHPLLPTRFSDLEATA